MLETIEAVPLWSLQSADLEYLQSALGPFVYTGAVVGFVPQVGGTVGAEWRYSVSGTSLQMSL